jgi:hypothetical protein
VVPWKALIYLIEPHYPKTSSKGGRPPYPLATMLRIHLLQQWYDLGLPRFRGQVDRSHAMTLRLSIDDQPNQDQAPVHASAEAGGY